MVREQGGCRRGAARCLSPSSSAAGCRRRTSRRPAGSKRFTRSTPVLAGRDHSSRRCIGEWKVDALARARRARPPDIRRALLVHGDDLSRAAPADLRRHRRAVATYVSQKAADNFIPHLTMREHVENTEGRGVTAPHRVRPRPPVGLNTHPAVGRRAGARCVRARACARHAACRHRRAHSRARPRLGGLAAGGDPQSRERAGRRS